MNTIQNTVMENHAREIVISAINGRSFQRRKTMKISLTDFINILFDKEAQEQFLKECEELGITNDDSKGADDE